MRLLNRLAGPTGSRRPLVCAGWLLAALLSPSRADALFWAFESGPVRPLALSADGTRLYAVNTPDNRLEIFAVSARGLEPLGSVPVGLEPVAVALRDDAEAWVVNHLSDSVSVVDLGATPPRVVRTLLVGDEPQDVVFASGRAFVTTARRGQNARQVDPKTYTPGVGRALVWVFDPEQLGGSLEGDPLGVVELFGASPRALAVSPDGSRVYAAVFQSGNRTAGFPDQAVGLANQSEAVLPGVPNVPLPQPLTDHAGALIRTQSMVVKFVDTPGDPANGKWRDDLGRLFLDGAHMKFTLPDRDVFEIDAGFDFGGASVPTDAAQTRFFRKVGTVLYNIAVNPVSGKLYVSNTDANNLQRFEGPGTYWGAHPANPRPGEPASLRGHLHETRITVIDPAVPSVTPRHLNKHLRVLGGGLYSNAAYAAADAAKSLAIPLGMAVSPDGSTLYLAAFGSSKIGVFSTAELESDGFLPSAADHIELSEGGPGGMVLDAARGRLYVATRFGNSITLVDLGSGAVGAELAVVPLEHDPEPPAIRQGRRLLYDARATSSNGEAACASCHVFGNHDDLLWDLGNPDGDVVTNANLFMPFNPAVEHSFHPMKGAMLTQSLRGMEHPGGRIGIPTQSFDQTVVTLGGPGAVFLFCMFPSFTSVNCANPLGGELRLSTNGAMHWRGDRTGASSGGSARSELEAFLAFNVAFDGLLGRSGPIDAEDMQAFANFILELQYPPNPHRALDNADRLEPEGRSFADGRAVWMGERLPADGNLTSLACQSCHRVDPAAGFFGTGGVTHDGEQQQEFKVPHLRNLYTRVGMFGMAVMGSRLPVAQSTALSFDQQHFGPQVRSLGYAHDGTISDLLNFMRTTAVTFSGTDAQVEQKRLELADFALSMPSLAAPVVGQQVTLTADNLGVAGPRIDLLRSRAQVTAPLPECELVATAVLGGEPRGFLFENGSFRADDLAQAALSDAGLRVLAASEQSALTYLCAPPGAGEQIGVDRDQDGVRNASQCGDASGDGVVAHADAIAVRRALAGLGSLPVPRKCNAIGPAAPADLDGDGAPEDCAIDDWVVIVRAGSGLPPAPAQGCAEPPVF